MSWSNIIEWSYGIHGFSTMGNDWNDNIRIHRCFGTFFLAYLPIQEWSRVEIRYYPLLLSTHRSLWFLIAGLPSGL